MWCIVGDETLVCPRSECCAEKRRKQLNQRRVRRDIALEGALWVTYGIRVVILSSWLYMYYFEIPGIARALNAPM